MRGATFIARADAFASAAESLFEEVIWLEDGDRLRLERLAHCGRRPSRSPSRMSADPDVIEARVTHTRKAHNVFDGYDRGLHWERTCAEISKLQSA
jgi:hypothetical protein